MTDAKKPARKAKKKAKKKSTPDDGIVPLAFGACALVLAYSIIHAVEKKLFPAPDPRLVLTVEHVAFFWNLVMSAYVAALVVAGTLAARRRFGPARVDRWIAPTAALAAVVGIAHAVLWP